MDYLHLGDHPHTSIAATLGHALAHTRPQRLVMVRAGVWRVLQVIETTARSAGVALEVRPDWHFAQPQAFAAWARGRRELRPSTGTGNCAARPVCSWRLPNLRAAAGITMPTTARPLRQQARSRRPHRWPSCPTSYLPAFYWTGETDMACLRVAITQTLELGYAHLIQRLMVTELYALLLGVEPRQVHAWYLAIYVDAMGWVELPNVLGMSQHADGGRMASKPYIASGKSIQRMSNYPRNGS